MTVSQARFVVRHGPTAQQEYPLHVDTTTIGREAANDIIINDPEISRRHAIVKSQAGRWMIEDLGSTNGTYVNGQRLNQPRELYNNDIVDIGDSVSLVFQLSGAAGGETILEQPGLMADPPTVDQAEGFPMPRYQAPQAPPQAEFDAAQSVGGESLEGAGQPAPNRTRLLVGCGCLVLLLVFACAASLFLLDAYSPDTLYCGPLQSIFEILGFSLSC
jgi:hypothetical protein